MDLDETSKADASDHLPSDIKNHNPHDQLFSDSHSLLTENPLLLTHLLDAAKIGYAIWDEVKDKDLFVSEEQEVLSPTRNNHPTNH